MAKVNLDFSFFEYLSSFYGEHKSLIRKNYRDLTKKCLDAMRRKPQLKNDLKEAFLKALVNKHHDKKAFNVEGHRELILKPIGIIDKKKKFSLGVGIYPSLYTDVDIVTNDDMQIILSNAIEDNDDSTNDLSIHKSFDLGKSKNLIN